LAVVCNSESFVRGCVVTVGELLKALGGFRDTDLVFVRLRDGSEVAPQVTKLRFANPGPGLEFIFALDESTADTSSAGAP
jgi:hypothetical protein